MVTACESHSPGTDSNYDYLVASIARATPDECIYWDRGTNNKGYGIVRIPGGRGKAQYAHRVAYSLHYQTPIPDGHDIDHLCRLDNLDREDLGHSCFNPLHMESVTHQENIQRGDLKRMGREHKKVKE